LGLGNMGQDGAKRPWLRGSKLRTARAGVGRLLAAWALVALCEPIPAKAYLCRPPRPLPPVSLHSMGPCAFNPDTLSFAGEPEQQAACLARPVGPWAKLGPLLDNLPTALAARVGRSSAAIDRPTLAALLTRLGVEKEFSDFLLYPISRAQDDDPFAPTARYFVIHDTSGPNFSGRAWPGDIDDNAAINNLARYRCADAHEIAHVVINRSGAMLVGHDFSVPWRATKFERATRFGTTLKGLFLHIELVQPRRRGAGGGDAAAPVPGFSAAQYNRLALLYLLASARAGAWLIPAYHAVIDNDIHDGHDDPQHFDLDVFALSLQGLIDQMQRHDEAEGAPAPAAAIPAAPAGAESRESAAPVAAAAPGRVMVAPASLDITSSVAPPPAAAASPALRIAAERQRLRNVATADEPPVRRMLFHRRLAQPRDAVTQESSGGLFKFTLPGSPAERHRSRNVTASEETPVKRILFRRRAAQPRDAAAEQSSTGSF
jgi:hypothetical protein